VSPFRIDDLSAAEQAVWSAFPTGAAVDLRTGDPDADDPAGGHVWSDARVVRAEVIAALLLGVQPVEAGHIPVVSLKGARISGRLVLAFARIDTTLLLQDCYFEQRPDLYFAALGFMSMQQSIVPGLVGSNLRVDGHLRMTGCSFTGEVALRGAKIAGGLLLDGAQMRPAGGFALDADRVEVAGDVLLDGGFSAQGEVRLSNARLGGSLALADAEISARERPALSADNVRIEGSIHAYRAQIEGQIRLQHASLKGGLFLSGARLSNPDGPAILGARLDAEEGLFLDHLSCDGEVQLSHARIGRTLTLADAELNGGRSGRALTVAGASVEGPLDGRGLTARGTLSLSGAHIAGDVALQRASLENAGGNALDGSGIQVGAAIDASEGFSARGTVNLINARIGSYLSFSDAVLRQPEGEALLCWRADMPELVLRPKEVEGVVNLQHARISILRDHQERWPGQLQLDGLTYTVLDPQLPARDRLDWLARDPRGHLASPYEQLAAVYRSQGRDADARTVQLARYRRKRPALAWYARWWGWLQDITVGYGYRPARAALWLLALLALGTAIFSAHPPPAFPGTSPPPFSPLIYTLNLIIPVVDFGQAHAFNPHGFEQWLSYVLIAAGWTLATTAATGVIRALRRD
jgi:hypothetical protein